MLLETIVSNQYHVNHLKNHLNDDESMCMYLIPSFTKQNKEIKRNMAKIWELILIS